MFFNSKDKATVVDDDELLHLTKRKASTSQTEVIAVAAIEIIINTKTNENSDLRLLEIKSDAVRRGFFVTIQVLREEFGGGGIVNDVYTFGKNSCVLGAKVCNHNCGADRIDFVRAIFSRTCTFF